MDLNIRSEKKLQEWREARNRVAVPETLKALAMKFVFENQAFFLGLPLNPFRNLPNNLVQDLMRMVKEADLAKYSLPRVFGTRNAPYRTSMKKFFLKLLNPNVTSFELPMCQKKEIAGYIKHLWDKCPKISRIVQTQSGALSYDQYTFMFPGVLQMKNCCPNLKHLCMQNYACTDDTLWLLQHHLPKLESLEFSLVEENLITMAGVDYLSKLNKLHFLHIIISLSSDCGPFNQEILAHSAGKIPHLRKMQITDGDIYWNKLASQHPFVEVFAQTYANKKLFVEELRLKELHQNWPPYLHVGHLILTELDPSISIDEIISIPSPVKSVTLKTVPIKQIYQILSKFGPHIIHLNLYYPTLTDPHGGPFESLDIFKIVESCPKLETLKLDTIKTGFIGFENLTSQHFTNYKEITWPIDVEAKNRMMKLFLSGSKAYDRKLSLKLYFPYALEALKENPTCLDKLQELEFVIMDSADHEVIDTAVEISMLLIFRSPYLERICFTVSVFHSDEGIEDYIASNHGETFMKYSKKIGVSLIFTKPNKK